MANVGVEYFFKPNISISATLDLGFGTQTYKTASKFDTEEKDVDKDYIKERNCSYKTSRDTFFATGITEWKQIRCSTFRKIFSFFTFPLFMMTFIPIALTAVFRKFQWQPISHTVAISAGDLQKP
jgi:hypothetical protein